MVLGDPGTCLARQPVSEPATGGDFLMLIRQRCRWPCEVLEVQQKERTGQVIKYTVKVDAVRVPLPSHT